jgi:hypothetical protein
VFDLVPVDHVATAITHATGGIQHIANPTLTTFDELVDHLRAIGYPLLDLDLTKWTHLIAADPTLSPAPPIDRATITRHVEFFVRSGFLTPPPQHS